MNNPAIFSASEVEAATSINYLLQPLKQWLDDPKVTEICVNRPGEVFTEADSVWTRTDVPELTLQHCDSIAIAAARFGGANIEESSPILSTRLPPDAKRVQFVRAPACEQGAVSITIRKPSHAIRTLEDYDKEGFYDHIHPVNEDLTPDEKELTALLEERKYMAFMRRAVQLEKVIVVAGETGSGKTTFMKALMQEIPTHRRILTIEDVPELFLPSHPNKVHMFYPSEASEGDPVTAARLLKSCLRMKPNRIMLAELRGPEAFDFINVAASGHGGSITSVHAGSPSLAFERLALMIQQNPQGRAIPFDVIQRLLTLVVDVVVHVHLEDFVRPGATKALGRHITGIWYDPMKKRGL